MIIKINDHLENRNTHHSIANGILDLMDNLNLKIRTSY